jgi:hypothetical protein
MFSKVLMEDADKRMFGMTEAEVIKAYEDSAFEGIGHIYIMGILSDVQECILRGELETARQYLNKAKFLISYTNRNVK